MHGYQRNSNEGRSHAGSLDARDVLFQDQTGEQNGNRRVERREDRGNIQASVPAGQNKKEIAQSIENTGDKYDWHKAERRKSAVLSN